MRTTDVVITSAISPPAVVALGLSDLLLNLPDRVSNWLVVGANTLVSQDTGAGESVNRDQALTQATILSIVSTLPFLVLFSVIGGQLLSIVGASGRSIRLGVRYLTIVAPVLPAMAAREVAANGLRAVGDTKTPMYVMIPMDGLNIILSITFGLGWFGVPRYGILAIGAATSLASVTGAILLVGYVHFRSRLSYTTPENYRIARQLVALAIPSSLTGFVTAFAVFPFNALLLSVGTSVNAGYQLAWRLYSQLVGPVSRGLGVAGQTLVGQRIGETEGESELHGGAAALSPAEMTVAMMSLTAGLAIVLGGATAFIAEPLVGSLAESQSIIEYGVLFLTFFGLISVVFVSNNVATGIMQGSSETRIPLISRLIGMYGGMVGVSWLCLQSDLGVVSFFIGLFACYSSMLAVVGLGFYKTDWVGRAHRLIGARADS